MIECQWEGLIYISARILSYITDSKSYWMKPLQYRIVC